MSLVGSWKFCRTLCVSRPDDISRVKGWKHHNSVEIKAFCSRFIAPKLPSLPLKKREHSAHNFLTGSRSTHSVERKDFDCPSSYSLYWEVKKRSKKKRKKQKQNKTKQLQYDPSHLWILWRRYSKSNRGNPFLKKQGRIHGNPSRVQVGRYSDKKG